MKKMLFNLIVLIVFAISIVGCGKNQVKETSKESGLRELNIDSKIYLLSPEELNVNAEISEDIKKDVYSWSKEDRENAIKNGFKEGYERLFLLGNEKDPYGTIEPFGLGISISRYSLSGIDNVFNERKQQFSANDGIVKNNLKLKVLPNPEIGDKSFAYVLVREGKQLSPEVEEDIRKNVYDESYIKSLSKEESEDLVKEKMYTVEFIKNNVWVEVTTMKYGYGLENSIKYAKMMEEKIE